MEIAEGQVDTLDEGPDKTDQEGSEGRQQEQPSPFSDGATDQITVDTFQVFLFEQVDQPRFQRNLAFRASQRV
jgi:hypothetical protein